FVCAACVCLSSRMFGVHRVSIFFTSTAVATTWNYTLSLHDALPISNGRLVRQGSMEELQGSVRTLVRTPGVAALRDALATAGIRSEEHTFELQSRFDLVCRLLLEKKKR